MPGRRFSEGLHQAIEAKEGVEIRRENMTLATITFQNFFRMYEKLAGMTGTAATESEEFEKTYDLDVVPIPTNLPISRDDQEDLIFMNEKAKWNSIVEEIRARHENEQPVLVGTVAIETSERLSKFLKKAGIEHEVLNAKAHEREAPIIADAGRPGAVTIATNMAGRGVDILLGGNPEGLAREMLHKQGVDVTEATPEEWDKVYIEAKAICEERKKTVLNAGGLYVLGTERHDARRIDNQLRGRSGRQGDPGETRFFLSLEDDLMRRFGGERVKGFMNWANLPEDEPIEHKMISNSIAQAQIRVEGHNFDIRKKVLEYDDVVNRQREIIYEQRKNWLSQDEDDLFNQYFEIIENEIKSLVELFFGEGVEEEGEIDAFYKQLFNIFPVPENITPDSLDAIDDIDDIESLLVQSAREALERKREELEAVQAGLMARAMRLTMLRAMDNHWQRHLTALDMLREGIGLMGVAQRDPLIEYQRDGFRMFRELQTSIDQQAARNIYQVQAQVAQRQPVRRTMRAHRANGGEAPKQETVRRTNKLGRNDPCHCGSGKKYKHCHMKEDRAKNRQPAG